MQTLSRKWPSVNRKMALLTHVQCWPAFHGAFGTQIHIPWNLGQLSELKTTQSPSHFFWDKKHDPNNPNAKKRGGISDGAPDFMRNNGKVAITKSTMKEYVHYIGFTKESMTDLDTGTCH